MANKVSNETKLFKWLYENLNWFSSLEEDKAYYEDGKFYLASEADEMVFRHILSIDTLDISALGSKAFYVPILDFLEFSKGIKSDKSKLNLAAWHNEEDGLVVDFTDSYDETYATYKFPYYKQLPAYAEEAKACYEKFPSEFITLTDEEKARIKSCDFEKLIIDEATLEHNLVNSLSRTTLENSNLIYLPIDRKLLFKYAPKNDINVYVVNNKFEGYAYVMLESKRSDSTCKTLLRVLN